MRFLVGPVENLGWPFYPSPALIGEYEIGGHEVYAFTSQFIVEGHSILAEPLDAVVLWDPMWFHHLTLKRVREIGRELQLPLIGVFGDWFAGAAMSSVHGTDACLRAVDGVVTDRVFMSHLRRLDWYAKPTEVVTHLLTYGRLPTLGGDTALVLDTVDAHPYADRSVDVGMIGSPHPYQVVLRGYYMDVVREICERRGWRCDMRNGVAPQDMEAALLDTKVCWNLSLGSVLNCRVYEALAAGCCLLTDAWNVDSWLAGQAGAEMYANEQMIEYRLEWFLGEGHGQSARQVPEFTWAKRITGTRFAAAHNPARCWAGVLDAAGRAAAVAAGRHPRLRALR